MASATRTPKWPLEYKMNKETRGLALIFNQEHFQSQSQRFGTDVDRDKLIERFEALQFRVDVHNDLTKQEMEEKLEAAKKNHGDADCFVCVILSHGEKDQISASDKEIPIKTITDMFKGDNCKSLVGKPKIFIIQACAGKKFDTGVTPMDGGDEPEEDPVLYTLPTGADFLMCYSVIDGFYSLRIPEKGGIYIQELCKALQEHGSTLEFTELLTMVNMNVSRLEISQFKQMPCFTSMLTKKLYFRSQHQ